MNRGLWTRGASWLSDKPVAIHGAPVAGSDYTCCRQVCPTLIARLTIQGSSDQGRKDDCLPGSAKFVFKGRALSLSCPSEGISFGDVGRQLCSDDDFLSRTLSSGAPCNPLEVVGDLKF